MTPDEWLDAAQGNPDPPDVWLTNAVFHLSRIRDGLQADLDAGSDAQAAIDAVNFDIAAATDAYTQLHPDPLLIDQLPEATAAATEAVANGFQAFDAAVTVREN